MLSFRVISSAEGSDKLKLRIVLELMAGALDTMLCNQNPQHPIRIIANDLS